MAFVDKSSVEPTIFFIEKISFSLKLSLVIFMGNPSLRLSEALISLYWKKKDFQGAHQNFGERSGSVGECLTRDRRAVVQASPALLRCDP